MPTYIGDKLADKGNNYALLVYQNNYDLISTSISDISLYEFNRHSVLFHLSYIILDAPLHPVFPLEFLLSTRNTRILGSNLKENWLTLLINSQQSPQFQKFSVRFSPFPNQDCAFTAKLVHSSIPDHVSLSFPTCYV